MALGAPPLVFRTLMTKQTFNQKLPLVPASRAFLSFCVICDE